MTACTSSPRAIITQNRCAEIGVRPRAVNRQASRCGPQGPARKGQHPETPALIGNPALAAIPWGDFSTLMGPEGESDVVG